jgi:hypothetical protein
MPLPGIMETPWAIAVKLGETNFQRIMEEIHKDWMKSGRIVELEKKWHLPPTDYACTKRPSPEAEPVRESTGANQARDSQARDGVSRAEKSRGR